MTIVTEIDRASFLWQGYLVEIATQQYPNGTIKPISLGGLGYHDVGAVTHLRGIQRFTGTLDPSLPAGKHTITTRLIQFIGVNVPVTAPNEPALFSGASAALDALLPHAVLPGPNAKILLEAIAEFSVNSASGASSDMHLSPLSPTLVPAMLSLVPIAANERPDRRRRSTVVLLGVIMLFASGASILPIVAADTLQCTQIDSPSGVTIQVTGNRPDGIHFYNQGQDYKHYANQPPSGECWKSPAGKGTDYYYYQGNTNPQLAGMYNIYASNGVACTQAGTTTGTWFAESSYTFALTNPPVTELQGRTDGYLKVQSSGADDPRFVICTIGFI